jgi:hypothetical protein
MLDPLDVGLGLNLKVAGSGGRGANTEILRGAQNDNLICSDWLSDGLVGGRD